MPIININIKNKIANGNKEEFIVCNNSDYEILFDFDQEWEKYNNKTAIVTLSNREFVPILFQGNKCKLPPFPNVMFCKVGVTASIENADETITISTTTPATINCLESATDENGNILPPSDSIYQEILAKLNEINLEQEPYNDLPLMDGNANAGSRKEYARGDHIHPSDNTKLDKVTKATQFHQLYGKTSTGEQKMYGVSHYNYAGNVPVYENATLGSVGEIDSKGTIAVSMPLNPYQATPKRYVDDGLSGKVDKVDPTTLLGRHSAYVVDPANANRKVLAIEDKAQCRLGNIPTYGEAARGNKPNGTGVLVTNTPTKPYQCANKLYVDAQKVYRHLVEFARSEDAPSMYIAVYSTNTTPFTSIDELPDDITFMALNSGDEYVSLFLKQGTSITECYVTGAPLIRFFYNNTTDYIFVSDTVTEL